MTAKVHVPQAAQNWPIVLRWSRLDDLCNGVFDCPHTTPNIEADGPYVVRSQDIRSGIFDLNQAARVSEDTYRERIERAEPSAGDLLYSREGTYFGVAAEVPENVRVCLGQRMVLIRPNPEILNSRFARYWLNSPVMAGHIAGHKDGSVAERLNMPTIRGLPIPVLDRWTQDAIAEILGGLDDKIELNRRMNETLEASARALFRDWFVDFGPTRTKAEGRPTYLAADIWSLFPDNIDDEGLPKGWSWGTLGLIAKNINLKVQPEAIDPETPYIGLEHMPRRSIALVAWEDAGKVSSAKSGFKNGQVLFGKLRPYFHKVGLAPVDGICSTDIVVMEARHERNAAILLACVSSDEFVAFTDQGSTGTKMPRTSWPIMSSYPIAIASPAIAERFQSIVAPMLDQIIANIHESRNLAATRDALLPKLMSGEIRLRNAEALAA